ncbi:MAG: TetR family transcriptional regulator [Planctomycetota bacterium]
MPSDPAALSAPQRHRTELLPKLTHAFARWGYRKATTARLAEHCGVQETELYRVWPSKQKMFLAAIDHVFDMTQAGWSDLLESPPPAPPKPPAATVAQRLLSHQSLHQGDHGFYRIIFAGLSETDDPEIRRALRRLYRRFHRYVVQQVAHHREAHDQPCEDQQVDHDAWGLVGLAAVCDIGRSLGMLTQRERQALMHNVGQTLLEDES